MKMYLKALLPIIMSVVMMIGSGSLPVQAAETGDEYYLYKTYFSKDLTETNKTIDQVLGEITTSDDSEREVVEAVTGWMMDNLTYDYNGYIGGSEDGRDSSLIAALENGIANDEGYAAVFDMFMYRAGISSVRVIGVADGYKHTWNKVMLDGKWYVIDVSWMDAGRPYNQAMYDLPTDISGIEYAELRYRLAEAENSYAQDAKTQYNLTDESIGWNDHEAVYFEITKVVDSVSELDALN